MKIRTSHNIIFTLRAYALGSGRSRTHPTWSDVVNTGTLSEIGQNK
ncbi:MAG: hypothetical protein ACQEXX_18635 [Bacillota bacterium]